MRREAFEFDQARNFYQLALEIRSAAVHRDSADIGGQTEYSQTLIRLRHVANGGHDVSTVRDHYVEAYDRLKQHTDHDESYGKFHRTRANVCRYLNQLSLRSNDLATAEYYIEQMLVMAERLVEMDRNNFPGPLNVTSSQS